MLLKRGMGLLFFMFPLSVWAAPLLNLQQAEQIALQQAPEIRQLYAKRSAFNNDAVAAGQWDDPNLMVGASNIPTDTFSFTQENMTQIQVGLMQKLPKGSSLAIRSQQDRLRASLTGYQKVLMKLAILRSIRTNWLNVYYWRKAIAVYTQEKQIFEHLLEVSTKLLENNQAQQKDVVKAQFELSQLDQKIIYARQQREKAIAALARWLPVQVDQLEFELPTWPTPPSLKRLRSIIKQQPLLLIDMQNSQLNRASIKLAKQQFVPGVNVGVVYGVRQGRDAAGNKRSNFIGAQATVGLPFFTKNRQTQRLKASKERYTVAQMQEMSDYRQLQSQLLDNYSAWKRSYQQYQIYRHQLVPESKHYAEATQISYQNKQTDFPTLARAYVAAYHTKLAALKVQIDFLQARVNLLYLQGS
jgi:outer membrane protein TolC